MTTETYKERKGFIARERQTKKERDKKRRHKEENRDREVVKTLERTVAQS